MNMQADLNGLILKNPITMASGTFGFGREFEDYFDIGILGGISTGQDIVVRVAFKPTSSILTPVPTIDKFGQETDIITKGRHDPCVGLRGVPVVEAMMACVLADHWLRHKAQCL